MFKRMLFKRVSGAVQRLENAMEKRDIRIATKTANWPLRDIYKNGNLDDNLIYE